MISIIAALDEKRGIGKDNDLLFRIPEDFERMKNLTMGHPLVMGRKLPGRYHVVITSNLSNLESLPYSANVVVDSLEEGLEKAKNAPGSEEIFIFGGGQIFKEAMEKDLVNSLYLTLVEGDYGADTFFPDYSQFDKVLKETSGRSGEYKYKFLDLEKS